MSAVVYLESFAALLGDGIHSPSGVAPWDASFGRSGPADVKREQVLEKPYVSYGKLSLPDKLAFSAASLILSRNPIEEKESSGISLGLPAGSLSTDLRYMESVIAGFPSPAVFAATLPSSAIADIAIFFGLKGENRVFTGGTESGLNAFECGVAMLEGGKAELVLVLSVNAVEAKDVSSPLLPKGFDAENRAFAFLLTVKPRTGGFSRRISASFFPGNKEKTCDGGELYFYELLTMLHAGGSGVIDCDAGDVNGRITLFP